MKKILEFDPSNNQAKRTILSLEPLAAEKREKMKDEMIGKLGNDFLLWFHFLYIKKLWNISMYQRMKPSCLHPLTYAFCITEIHICLQSRLLEEI